MKKHFTIAALLLLSALGKAQEIRLVSETANQMIITNKNSNPALGSTALNGKNYVDFKSVTKVFTMDKGAPAVPVYTGSVIVPDQGNASIVVTYDGFTDYDNVDVLPSKGSLKRNIDPAKVPYEFGAAYAQDAFYPGQLATMSNPFVFRDFRGTTVSFHPYQYNPVAKKLRVYNNISVTIVTDANSQGVNDKELNSAPSKAFGQMYQSLFMNASSFYEPVAENGEMLIISPEEYLETIAPLAEWKVLKGIRTTVVSLEDTGDSPETIKDYIQGFYEDNPALTYVLLVGDHEDLPCYTYGLSGGWEELWSDSYYAQLEGDDFFPEVLIGRFSGSVQDVNIMVSRTLEYEKTPHEGDWMTRAAGIGSEEGEGYGDDGEPDWQHLRNIGDKLLESGYTYINEFYDGSHGINDGDDAPEPSMISEAVNEGIGLLNYCGHGAQDVFVTGWYTSDDVYTLDNTGKYPFVVSVACNNGTFTGGTSICEAWVRSKTIGSPTGAIAACGSSILMAWAEPMQTQDAMAELIALEDPLNVKTTLGGLFYNGQVSMLEAYGLSLTAVEVMQTWVFFGDPSVVYRNKETLNLDAEHAASIAPGTSFLGVECNVEGAFVSITQNGVIIGTGIVAGGEVVVALGDFDDSAPLTVTITQQNYLPYQGTVSTGTMGNDKFSDGTFALYPNPAKDFVTVKSGSNISDAAIEVREMTGKLIYTVTNAAFENNAFTLDTSSYASGVYLLIVQNNHGKAVKRFVVR